MKNFNVLYLTAIFLLLLAARNSVNCGRILIIIPMPLFSHQIVYRNLNLELMKRGHEIVFATPLPIDDPSIANYTDKLRQIYLSEILEFARSNDFTSLLVNFNSYTKYEIDEILHYMTNKATEFVYNNRGIKELLENASNEKFDLVIIEAVVGISLYPIAHILKAPLIAIGSMELHLYQRHLLGVPFLPSHPSNWEFIHRIGPEMSFWDRLQNFVLALFTVHHWYHFQSVTQEQLVKRLIKNDIPPLYDIARNLSLLMINYDILLGYPIPLPPNVISFTGLHIQKVPPPLPKDISEFLESANNGFVYMSLGCNMKSAWMDSKVVRAMYNVFSRLPQKVLWKYEMDDIPSRNGNVLTSKWFPQQAVLAHRNIKLFIFQGGVQSTEETIHYGVPIIGMPAIFEQIYRIDKLVELGVGRRLDFHDIDEEMFHEGISDVINNKSYKAKMTELSRLKKDKPYDSKEHAVWWIEYVMRNKGIQHLRYSGMHDPWYQQHDMDIIAFFSVILFIAAVIFLIIFVRCLLLFGKYLYPSLIAYLLDLRKKIKAE